MEPITLMPAYGFTSLSQAINTLISVAFFLAALAAFFFMLLGGLRYITSGGSDEGTKAARATFRNAIVGLILMGLTIVLFRVLVTSIPGMNQYFSFQ